MAKRERKKGDKMKNIIVCADFAIKCEEQDLPKIYKKLKKALNTCKLIKGRGGISFYKKLCEEK